MAMTDEQKNHHYLHSFGVRDIVKSHFHYIEEVLSAGCIFISDANTSKRMDSRISVIADSFLRWYKNWWMIIDRNYLN